MITNQHGALECDWRSYQERCWIPIILCPKHIRQLTTSVPVRIRQEGQIHPASDCQICKSEVERKYRLLTAGEGCEPTLIPPLRKSA